jgi:hypothetical protein
VEFLDRRTGHKCFVATIWPRGQGVDWLYIEILFSANLEALARADAEPPAE